METRRHLTNDFDSPRHMIEKQLIRDLQWAIQSPSLLAPNSPDVFPVGDSSNEIELSDRQRQELVAFVNERKTRRVGYYFETLLQFWLERVCGFQIVAAQQQIQDKSRTIGEVDFLYQDESRQLIHLETAVKFYLHYPIENESGSYLIGPNAADNFEKKMRRLFDHQLPLSKQYFPDVKRRFAFVKGRIFYRIGEEDLLAESKRLSDKHLRGSWLYAREIEQCFVERDSLYRIQRKPFWLASDRITESELQSRTPKEFEPHLSAVEISSKLRQHFANNSTPLLVSEMKPVDDQFVETNRMFVVSDQWPKIKAAVK